MSVNQKGKIVAQGKEKGRIYSVVADQIEFEKHTIVLIGNIE